MSVTVDPDVLEAFNATRDFSDKAVHALCYAPFTSLYFDSRGNVRACCHNFNHPVGNIIETGIDEIWHGARNAMLRAPLTQNRFGPGCDFCAFQMQDGSLANLSLRRFDQFAVEAPAPAPAPAWPRQMEFSISNVCNLECIMLTSSVNNG